MLNNTNEAKEEIKKLKALIVAHEFQNSQQQVTTFNQLQEISQVANLHLFIAFDEDFDSLIQLFQEPLFEQCMLTNGHHLIKYLIAAMLLQKNYNFTLVQEIFER